jgi:hypothetical protein
MYGSSYQGKPVDYHIFYNPTGGFWADLAEVFAQRSEERWELFWDWAIGGQDMADAVGNVVFNQLTDILLNQSTSTTAAILSGTATPAFTSLVDDFAWTINSMLAEQRMVLAIAHSQGNLFVNPTYDAVVAPLTTDSIRVVHVAPASLTSRGPYTTSASDLVIQSLLATSGGALVANYPLAPHLEYDWRGHGFLEIYLNSALSIAGKVRGDIDLQLAGLQPPISQRSSGLNYAFASYDAPGSRGTLFHGINGAGNIVGVYATNEPGLPTYGLLLSGGVFTTLNPGSPLSWATGINASNTIVGSFSDSNYQHTYGFIYSGGGYTFLSDPSAYLQTFASGINDMGEIVGSSDRGGPFLYSNSAFTSTFYPSTLVAMSPNGINDAGQIVGTYWSGLPASPGVLLSRDGSYCYLGFPGADSTSPNGINGYGDVVGGYDDQSGTHGFVLRAGAFVTIDFPGSSSTSAQGINDAGVIVGYYSDASGGTHGFVATPLP